MISRKTNALQVSRNPWPRKTDFLLIKLHKGLVILPLIITQKLCKVSNYVSLGFDGSNIIFGVIAIIPFLVQACLTAFQKMVFCLINGGGEGKVSVRRVLPSWLRQIIKLCRLRRKILKLDKLEFRNVCMVTAVSFTQLFAR